MAAGNQARPAEVAAEAGRSTDAVGKAVDDTAMALGTNFDRSDAVFPNPERGEIGWADFIDQSEGGLQHEINQGATTLRVILRLDEYRWGTLPENYLSRLQAGFDRVRRSGAKVIPRFVYNYPMVHFEGGVDRAGDSSRETVRQHIAQLGPLISRNRDVIAWVEAGFIGAWGEWHSSADGLDSPEGKAYIRDALLEHFPADRKLLFRYPADLVRWYPNPGDGGNRIGVHNDCVLSGQTDGGTWRDGGTKAYVRGISLAAPYAGETCQLPPMNQDCSAIREHGQQLRLSALTRSGPGAVFWSAWESQGCLAEVKRSLGYRLVLESLQVSSETVQPGQSIAVRVRLRNVGWAPLYNYRPLQVVFLVNGQPAHRVELPDSDLVAVHPEGDSPDGHAFQSQVTVPADLPQGSVELALAAPDAMLGDDARRSLRFANSDRDGQGWVAEGGYFRTGLWLQSQR